MSMITGKDHVYGTNGNHKSFRMVSPTTDGSKLKFKWEEDQMYGRDLSQVSASKASSAIWGVNPKGNIFYKSSPLEAFEPIDGGLKQVEAGGLGVFGVHKNGHIHYRIGTHENPGSKGTEWQQ